MTEPSFAIADLQKRWHTLTDADRAASILPLIESGVSQRRVARALNCSEALIRRLVGLLKAEPEDLELARRCVISTNELARRAKQSEFRRAADHQRGLELKRAQTAANGTTTVLHWLAADPSRRGNAEQIIEEARFKLSLAEQTGGLPQDTVPVAWTLDEIIRQKCPAKSDDDVFDVGWFASWLVLWCFYGFPNRQTLWQVLDQALSRVEKRGWAATFGSSPAHC
jgi:hypothetical protein